MLIAISAIVVHALAPPQAPSLSGVGAPAAGSQKQMHRTSQHTRKKTGRRACTAGRWGSSPDDGCQRLEEEEEEERLEEEERDNAYDKAGFLSFMEFGGFDLRQVGYCGGFGRYGRVALAARACRLVHVWLMCPCTWVRCCLVFSVLFGGLLGERV